MTPPRRSDRKDRALFGSPWCLHWRGARYWSGVRLGRFKWSLTRTGLSTPRLALHWLVYGGPDL
jgi:hypothetical protein